MRTSNSIFLAFALLSAASAAQAAGALPRAYLSVNGKDSNPCTQDKPCRLLPAALAAVQNRGEVWMVDSGDFNSGPVAINQNQTVTILAIPGVVGSLVAIGGDALDVQATSVGGTAMTVTLRNLKFRNTGAFGQYDGVHVTGKYMDLIVEDSEFTDGFAHGVFVDATTAGADIHASVTRSTIGGPFTFALEIDGSAATQNAEGSLDHCRVVAGAGGAIRAAYARVAVNSSTITNSSYGVEANDGAVISLDNVVIAHALAGVHLTGSGIVQTAGNNAFRFNTADVSGGVLTAAPQL